MRKFILSIAVLIMLFGFTLSTIAYADGTITFDPPNPSTNSNITVTVSGLPQDGDYYSLVTTGKFEDNLPICEASSNNSFQFMIPPLPAGTWKVTVQNKSAGKCSEDGNILASGSIIIPEFLTDPATTNDNTLPCAKGEDKNGKIIEPKNDPELEKSIVKCLEINTAIGNVTTNPTDFVRFIFNVVLGLSGGIALIMIILSGYKFMVSAGNPEATKAAGGQLTSAIIGLLFIIFSFVILQIVGVDILNIPGFGK